MKSANRDVSGVGKQVQSRTDPFFLLVPAHVGMPNAGYILYLLNSHDADQRGCLLKAPEHNTLVDFVRESLFGHIWVCPAIGWDDPSISLRSIINDAQDLFKIPVIAAADH
jgi:hypothetical protein